MGEVKRKTVFAPLQRDLAPAAPPVEPAKWPEDNPGGWSHDAAAFLKLVQQNPLMWTMLMRAKYLQLRVDTRDGGFSLWDRDGKPLHPDEVVQAIDKMEAMWAGASARKVARKINTAAEKAVDTILADLHDRRGIGGELDQIRDDPEIYAEIRKMMVDAIVKQGIAT